MFVLQKNEVHAIFLKSKKGAKVIIGVKFKL